MAKNLFGAGGAIRPIGQETELAKTVDGLMASLSKQGGMQIDASTVKSVMAMESLSTNVQADLATAVQNLESTITSCVKSAQAGVKGAGKLNYAQEAAAVSAGILATSPREFLAAPLVSESKLQAVAAGTTTNVIGHGGLSGALENRGNLGLEAYDNKENRNTVVYSVAYNMNASRQDEFGEAFYPTVVVTPDNVGFLISIRLHYVVNEVRRSLSGSLSNFNRINIIKAIVDPTILRNDITKLTPVVRSSGGANDSTAFFVEAAVVAPTTVTVDQFPVLTAPLAVGKKFDLLAVSQTDALIQAGVLDQTDAIDSSMRLGALYVQIPATTGANAHPAKVIKFNTNNFQSADFNAAVQGNTRLLNLNFNTDTLLVTSETKAIDGSAIPQLAGITDSFVRLSTSMFGTVLQDKGDTTLNTGGLSVGSVTTAEGSKLDLTASTGLAIATIFANATVIGYDLIGYRTNSNRRQRGQLVDTQFVNNLYTVPLLPPVTALRPVGETEANDSALLASLITATKIRTSNSAVTALLEAQAILKEYVSAADATVNAPIVLGVASYLVVPTYEEFTLDVAADIDSLKSSDRTDDLVALIVNKIRDMSYRMYTNSAYKAAAEAIFDGAAPKPMVIIGCDPIVARYLTLDGDMRTLGDYFDFKMVSTLDNRVPGKIFITFGMESSFNSGVPNPLHFGAMAWKPELTLMMPINRNGAMSYELTVSPSYRHITNLPILGVINIENVQTVIASKVSIHTTVVGG